MSFRTNIRTLVAGLAFAAFAMTASASFAEDAKVPTTATEHEALAKQYRDQAAHFKKVGDEHRAMADAYAKAHPDSKGGMKSQWDVKMQKHCQMLSKDADKLAVDADKAADYHSLRAKELQGK